MKMTQREILFLAVTFLVALVSTGIAYAGDPATGCKLEGVWTAGDPNSPMPITATFHGKGDNEGAVEMEHITDPAYVWWEPNFINPYGYYPNSRSSAWHGVWAKIDAQTYRVKAQSYVVQRLQPGPDFGVWQPPFFDLIAVISVHESVWKMTDCNTAEMEGESKSFYPGEKEPFFVYPAVATAKRFTIDQPYPYPTD